MLEILPGVSGKLVAGLLASATFETRFTVFRANVPWHVARAAPSSTSGVTHAIGTIQEACLCGIKGVPGSIYSTTTFGTSEKELARFQNTPTSRLSSGIDVIMPAITFDLNLLGEGVDMEPKMLKPRLKLRKFPRAGLELAKPIRGLTGSDGT